MKLVDFINPDVAMLLFDNETIIIDANFVNNEAVIKCSEINSDIIQQLDDLVDEYDYFTYTIDNNIIKIF